MSFITISDFEFKPNWLKSKAYNMFNSLTFDNYFLAGNSVANAIKGISLQGDLDFWITKQDSIIPTFNEFAKYYEVVELYPSMIKLYNIDGDDELPEINLIYTNMQDYEATILCFDLDYCRCLFHPKIGLKYANECIESIETNKIRFPINVINRRIIKALGYGYSFTYKFWEENYDLLNVKLNKSTDKNKHIEIHTYELKPSAFKFIDKELIITDISNIEKTLSELIEQIN